MTPRLRSTSRRRFGGFIKSVRPNAELNTGDVLQFALVTRIITFLSRYSRIFVLPWSCVRWPTTPGAIRARQAKHPSRDELI